MLILLQRLGKRGWRMETRSRSGERRNQSDWVDYGSMAMYGGVYVTLHLLTPKYHDRPGNRLHTREPMIRLVFFPTEETNKRRFPTNSWREGTSATHLQAPDHVQHLVAHTPPKARLRFVSKVPLEASACQMRAYSRCGMRSPPCHLR